MPDTSQPISVTYGVDEAAFMRACNALWSHRALGRRGTNIAAAGVVLCAGYLIVAADPHLFPYVLLGLVAVLLLMTQLRDYLWRRAYRKSDKYATPHTQPDLVDVHVLPAHG